MNINTLFLDFIASDGFVVPLTGIFSYFAYCYPNRFHKMKILCVCQTLLLLLFSSRENVKKRKQQTLLTKKIELYSPSCYSSYTVVLFHYSQRISTDITDHGYKMDKIHSLRNCF